MQRAGNHETIAGKDRPGYRRSPRYGAVTARLFGAEGALVVIADALDAEGRWPVNWVSRRSSAIWM